MRRSLLLITFCLPVLASADNLPDYVLAVPDNVRTVLVAETDTATLHRHKLANAEQLSTDSRPMSLGQNGVAKERTGDRRTPLGIYFIIENLDTRNLHEKYGPVAFPLDYPNAWDVSNARTGYGIWIHGVEPGTGPRPALDTDGCIALANDDLLSLEPDLTPLRTPIVVTRKIDALPRAERGPIRERLLAALDDWQQSYAAGDWFTYLSLYADEFSFRGMNKDEWSAFRLQSIGNRSLDDYSIDNIYLLEDPEEEGLFLSRFVQRIVGDGATVETTKRLYWRQDAAGEFKIVAEDNG